jgi:hypothetical protein
MQPLMRIAFPRAGATIIAAVFLKNRTPKRLFHGFALICIEVLRNRINRLKRRQPDVFILAISGQQV